MSAAASTLTRTFLNTTIPRSLAPNMNAGMRSYFSTTPAPLSNAANANPNPSYPLFSLKRISPNPRVRMAVGAGLAVLTVAEGYMVMKYWPRIMGRETKGEGSN